MKVSEGSPISQIPHVKKIIAVMSGKGGVGKSTISFQLGKELARHGLSVGLLDADIHGPSMCQIAGEFTQPIVDPHTHKTLPLPIFWEQERNMLNGCFMSVGALVQPGVSIALRGPMVNNAIKQMLFEVAWGLPEQPLDFLVVDMPPGSGDAHLCILKYAQPDGVILVSTPDILSLIDMERTVHMLRKTETFILGIIENMSYFTCQNCHHDSPIFDHDTVSAFAQKLDIPFLGSIPIDLRIRQNDPTMPRYLDKVYQCIMGNVFPEVINTSPDLIRG